MAAPTIISVIVPVRNDAAGIASCLDALAGQLDAGDFEVVVVDNASSDGTADAARSHPVGPLLVTEPRPGSYAARNAGVAASRGGVLAFTDADCAPEPDWLAQGLAALGAGADLAGGDVVATARDNDRPNAYERYDRAVYLRQAEAVVHDSYAATANLFVRREVFEAVGGFDASLRSGGDVEFGQRAAAAGFRIAHAPAARVRHPSRASLGATWRLHRRIGAGWAALARQGARPAARRDPALRLALGTVVDRAAAMGAPVRRRDVAHIHAIAMAARWTGRLTGRG